MPTPQTATTDPPHATDWPHRHLVGIEPLSADEIRTLLSKAQSYEGVSTSRALPTERADRTTSVLVMKVQHHCQAVWESSRGAASLDLAGGQVRTRVLREKIYYQQ